MACLDDDQLARYVAGSERDVRPIVHHVERCADCQRRVVTAVWSRRTAAAPVTSVEAWLALHRRRPVGPTTARNEHSGASTKKNR